MMKQFALDALEEPRGFYDTFFVTSTCFYVNNDIRYNIKMLVVT